MMVVIKRLSKYNLNLNNALHHNTREHPKQILYSKVTVIHDLKQSNQWIGLIYYILTKGYQFSTFK